MPTAVPVCIVDTLAQAIEALTAAAEAGIEIRLASPVGAAGFLGVGYFQTLVALARQAVPQATATALLDCGESPGLALAALRAGMEAVRVTTTAEIVEKLRDIAAHYGGSVFTSSSDPSFRVMATPNPAATRIFLVDSTNRNMVASELNHGKITPSHSDPNMVWDRSES
jgi:hypothetical protein